MIAVPLQAIALVGLWVWALWSLDMRSVRTVAVLSVTTVVFLSLAMVSGPIFVILRVALLCAVVLTFLFRGDLFFTRSPGDRAFDLAYSRVQHALSDLARQRLAGTVDRRRFAHGIDAAVVDLKRLDPPDAEWEEIHRETIVDLERWLAMGGGDPTVPEPELHISDLQTRHRRLRERRRRGWRRIGARGL
jgi:hypothetical protein